MTNWEPPLITTMEVSRAAFGFDNHGQLVSEVSGQALRAIHVAMQQTLQDVHPNLQDSDLKAATQAWIVALNHSLPDMDPFSENWIKGTMHSYSTEFFFLADTYARQICQSDERYVRNLVRQIVPTSLKQISQTISLTQLYKSDKTLFMNAPQPDLRVVSSGFHTVTIQWRSTSMLARVGVKHRANMLENMRQFIRIALQDIPQIMKGIENVKIEETTPSEEAYEWQISWREGFPLPRLIAGGLVLSLILSAVALTALPAIGYVALVPLFVGIIAEGYQHTTRRVTQQEQALIDQVEYNRLQTLELTAAYDSLRSSSQVHEQQVEDLTSVRNAVLAISSSFDQEHVMDGLIDVMTGVLRFDRAMVLLRDKESNILSFGALSHPPNDPNDMMRLNMLRLQLDDEQGNLKDDPLITAWLNGQSLMVKDPSMYFGSSLNWILALLEFNTFYSVPLMLGGKMLGVIIVDNHFTRLSILPENRSLVDALATNIAITMENARLYHLQDAQLEKNLEEMQLMEQVDRELSDNLQLDVVLELLMDWALRFTDARLALVWLVDEKAQTMQVGAIYGGSEDQLPGGKLGQDLSLNEAGISGRAARIRQRQVVDDVAQDSDYLEIMPEMKSAVAVPILRQRRVVGVMTIESDKPNGFTQEHVQFIERLGTRTGVALENSRLFTETQQEREKLSTILATTKDSVIVLDHEGKLLLVNQAAVNTFGLESAPATFEDKDFRETFHNKEAFLAVFDAAGKNDELTYVEQCNLDGKTFNVSVVKVSTVGYTILLHDVTYFKELDSLKNAMVSTVSHDLKSPLSVMKGYAELVRMTQDLNEKGSMYLHRILRSVDNMRQLIDDLLDMARIETGLHLEYEKVNMLDIVKGSIEELALRADEKALKITQTVPPNMPPIMGEKRRIKQIFHNLLSNAVKYTLPEGSVEIIISTDADMEMLKVEVKDSGVGIGTEDLARVWDRFERIRHEKTADEEGTGLGLAIVKSLVEVHGGEIGVDSVLDEGSNFWFTMPIYSEQRLKELLTA